ncbi:MAG: coproporphyrinogen III oxidase, partial [Pseudomonadota bacterium]
RLRARLIEALMCDFRISASETTGTFGISPNALKQIFAQADAVFPGLLDISQDGLFIPKHVRPLTRMIARCFDAYDSASVGHSSAI